MTSATDQRRRQRAGEAVRQPPSDPAVLHGMENAMAELLNSLGAASVNMKGRDIGRLATGVNKPRFWTAYDAAHAALNAYREGK